MSEFLKAYWLPIALILVIIAFSIAASEYLDAATSLLPGAGER